MIAAEHINRQGSEAVAPLVLRLALGAVFLVFGFWKASSPVDWIIFAPDWLPSLLEGVTSIDTFGFLKLVGFAEGILGVQLLLGLFTRTTAALCSLGLLAILFHIGLDQIGIRDIGLLGASVALSLSGGGPWSADRWLSD